MAVAVVRVKAHRMERAIGTARSTPLRAGVVRHSWVCPVCGWELVLTMSSAAERRDVWSTICVEHEEEWRPAEVTVDRVLAWR